MIKMREANTDVYGEAFPGTIIKIVWRQGLEIPRQDPDYYRTDRFGKLIKWDDYGNRSSEFGWEIDHIQPVVSGGTDILSNLQPLHWRNNDAKGDRYFWDG